MAVNKDKITLYVNWLIIWRPSNHRWMKTIKASQRKKKIIIKNKTCVCVLGLNDQSSEFIAAVPTLVALRHKELFKRLALVRRRPVCNRSLWHASLSLLWENLVMCLSQINVLSWLNITEDNCNSLRKPKALSRSGCSLQLSMKLTSVPGGSRPSANDSSCRNMYSNICSTSSFKLGLLRERGGGGICADQSCTQIAPSPAFPCASWCQLSFRSAVLQRANGAACVEAIRNRIDNETRLEKKKKNHHPVVVAHLAPRWILQALSARDKTGHNRSLVI